MLDWLLRPARRGASGPAEAAFQDGIAAQRAGKLEDAVKHFARAAAAAPRAAAAHCNLGAALRDLGRADEALAACERAIALDPAMAEAHYNAGAIRLGLGRFDEAAQALRRAAQLQPKWAEAHGDLGNALMGAGDAAGAAAAFRRALEARPDDARSRWALAMVSLPAIAESDAEMTEARAAFARELDALEKWFAEVPPDRAAEAVGAQQPFYLAYHDEDNRDLLARYGALCVGLMARWQRAQGLAPRGGSGGRKKRIGIVCAHLHDHSVWTMLVRGWLEHLDRGRFETHVFSLGAQRDRETDFARKHCARFVEGPKTLAAWAEAIHGGRFDALVYPEVGMDAMSLRLACLRLAPLQATSLGHPQTSGLPTMDAYLSAEALEPAGGEAHYTERLVRLPKLGCWFPHLKQPSARPPDLARLGIAPDAVVLLSPGTPFKYIPRHDWMLAEIAKRVERGRIVFFEPASPGIAQLLRRRLRKAFEARGVDFARRAAFAPWTDRAGFQGWLERADLYLDTVGFSGFNTPMQALDCGLPIVAREGRFARGRQASGMLRQMGLGELVAESDDAYVEIAAKLARDKDWRSGLKKRIRESSGPLFEDLAPIRAMEAFLAGGGKSP